MTLLPGSPFRFDTRRPTLGHGPSHRHRPSARRLRLEPLEARQLLAAPQAVDDFYEADQNTTLQVGVADDAYRPLGFTGFEEPGINARNYTSVGGEMGFTQVGSNVGEVRNNSGSNQELEMRSGSGGEQSVLTTDAVDTRGFQDAVGVVGVRTYLNSGRFESDDFIRITVEGALDAGAPVFEEVAVIFDEHGASSTNDPLYGLIDPDGLGGTNFTTQFSDFAGISTDYELLRIVIDSENDSGNEYFMYDNVGIYARPLGSGPSVLNNDTDADFDPLTVNLVDGPDHGTLTLNPNGSFTYTPEATFLGQDTFTYQASDGTELSNVATVTIDVVDANAPPIVVDDVYTVPEDGSLAVDVATGVLSNDSDPEGLDLTAALDTPPQNGQLQFAADGSFVYTPNADFWGNDTFTYVANDGNSDSVPATVTVTVQPLPDAPVSADDSYTIRAGETLVASAPAPVTPPLVPQAVMSRGAAWKYRDDIENDDPYPVDASLRSWTAAAFDDSSWLSGPAILGYGGINSGPIVTTLQFGPDEDNKRLTYLLRSTFALTDAARAERLDFDVMADDGAAVYINGTEVLRMVLPGVVGDGALTTSTRATTFTSEQYEQLSVDMTQFPGVLVEGVNTIAVELHQSSVTSSDVGWDTGIVAQVRAVPPIVGVLGNDFDADGHTLTAVLEDDVDNGTLSLAGNGTFTYVPNAGASGLDTFTYRAEDGTGRSDTAVASILVIPQGNTPPTANDDTYFVDEDLPLQPDAASGVLANDVDDQGDPMTASLILGAMHGTLDLRDDGSFDYQPDPEFSGLDSFTYQATDGFDVSTVATVSIVVSAVNDVPVANADLFLAQADQPVVVTHPTQTAKKTFLERDGQVVIEAEDFSQRSENARRWYVIPDEADPDVAAVAGASGSYIQSQPSSAFAGPFSEPWVDYVVRVSTPGTYRLWLRQDGPGDNADTLFAHIVELGNDLRGGELDWYEFVASNDRDFNTDPWLGSGGPEANSGDPTVEPALWPIIEPGDYTIRIVMREGGSAVDALVLQLETLPDPVGVGPTRSPSIVPDDGPAVLRQHGIDALGSRDTTLHQFDAAGGSGNTGGRGPSTPQPQTIILSVGDDDPAGSGGDVQSLLQFDDLIGMQTGQVPPLAQITQATLVLNVVDGGSGFSLHRMLTPWEDLTTWSAMTDGVQGDDVEAAAIADAVVGSGNAAENVSPGLLQIDVTTSVQAWADGGENLGWALLPLPGGSDLLSVASSQGTFAPMLLVSFAEGAHAQQTELVPLGSVWRYLDDGSDQGTAWIAPDFDDSAWDAGAAQLGYGDGDETTVVSFGPDDNNKHITTYFRHQFEATDLGSVSQLVLQLQRDDGAAVYLNGTEIARTNLADIATFLTEADNAIDDGGALIPFDVPAHLVHEGTNVLAVEVHQSDPDSSDLSFDLRLTAQRGLPLLVNDFDVEGDALTALLVDQASHGTVALNADGTFIYLPDAGFTGTDRFAYRVTDGQDQSAPTTATLLVRSTGEAPTAFDDEYEVTPGQTLVVGQGQMNGAPTVADFDTPGTPFTIDTDSSNPAAVVDVGGDHGAVLRLTERIDGLHNGVAFDRSATGAFDTVLVDFDFRITGSADGFSVMLVDTAQFGITGDAVWTYSETPWMSGGFGVGFDHFGDNLLQVYFDQENLGEFPVSAFDLDNGLWNHAQVRVESAAIGSTVSVTLTPEGGAPVEVVSGLAVPRMAPYESRVSFGARTGGLNAWHDIDNLHVQYLGRRNMADIVSAGSQWKYSDDGVDLQTAWIDPAFDDSAWDQGRAQLGYGDGDEATVVSFGGDDQNKHPTTYFRRQFEVTDLSQLHDLVLYVVRDDGMAAYLNGVEVARDNLIDNAAYGDYAGGAVGGGNESVFFAYPVDPALLALGTNVLAVEIHQDSPDSSDISFDLRLATSGAAVGAGVLANDVDNQGDPLTAVLVDDVQHGTLALAADGSFQYTPNPGYAGPDRFTYRADDGAELSNVATVELVADVVNTPPQANDDAYTADEDDVLVVPAAQGVLANDTDPEQPTLQALLIAAPQHGEVTLNGDGSFEYTPDPNFFGPDVFTYRAFDGIVESFTATVTVTVQGLPDPPEAFDDLYVTPVDVALLVDAAAGVLANDVDPDGDGLTALLQDGPDHGSLDLDTDGSLLYTPDPGFGGIDTFAYLATDGVHDSNVATVTVIVNHLPTTGEDTYSVDEDTTLTVDAAGGVLANDSDLDGDPLTAVLATSPASGTLALSSDGAFVYTPAADFFGIDTFSYHADDSKQQSSPVLVTIDVLPVNDAPIAYPDRYEIVQDGTLDVTDALGVLVNDFDPESDPLSAQLIEPPTDGQLGLNADGSFTYVADPGFSGLDRFVYAASDGQLESPPVVVEIEVFRPGSRITINEVMYHPASENTDEEFIELLNRGGATIDLEGWQFTRGVDFTFPAIQLAPGELLIVAADPTVFAATYTTSAPVLGGWTGQLSNRGETIELVDAEGVVVDEVEYSDHGAWARRERGPWDDGSRGWVWVAEHDGGGHSLELVNPQVSNELGQNWAASGAPLGTPGAANSVAATNIAPVVADVQHTPAIPRSDEPVTITVELVDELVYAHSATLYWRVASLASGPFIAAPMFDDGLHGDGAALDGRFGVVLPPHADRSVVEFYVSASDLAGNQRTWPLPTDESGTQGANLLYQVDDAVNASNQPVYRIIMTPSEMAEFDAIDRNSRAQMNATFVHRDGTGDEVRYNAGVRLRGASSRFRDPPGLRVNFPHDAAWQGVTQINLNTQFTWLQLAGSALFRAAGLPGEEATAVQVRLNGDNRAGAAGRQYGSYVRLEVVNSEFAENHFPDDSNGNLYKKVRPDRKWTYRAGDGADYEDDGWSKQTNASAADWTDLDQLMLVMNTASGTSYVNQIGPFVDIDQWVRWFALMMLMNSRETSLANGTDDDYSMYRGVSDPRFLLLPHDLDTIFGQGDTTTQPTTSIFPAIDSDFAGESMPQLVPFFNDPDIQARYYEAIHDLIETVFAPQQLGPMLDNLLGEFTPQNLIDDMKQFAADRVSFVLTQIPPRAETPVAEVIGAPPPVTPLGDVSLTVGGQHVVSYSFRVDGGAFGAETDVAAPIELTAFPDGAHSVQVIGRNAAGLWQSEEDAATISWTVDSSYSQVRLSEVLAVNRSMPRPDGTLPDWVELVNAGDTLVDMTGMSLSDSLDDPFRFVFAPGSTLQPGAFLVLYGGTGGDPAATYLDFALDGAGEALYLFGPEAGGSVLLDQVEFGMQLPDLSLARGEDFNWHLSQPTPSADNVAAPSGDPQQVVINEWLASADVLFRDDLIELYNPSTLPVDLGGFFLTDDLAARPHRHEIAPHSFIGGESHGVFVADSQTQAGPDHVDFVLSAAQEMIALLDGQSNVVDLVLFGPQATDVSQGRSPDGGPLFHRFSPPSIGLPNPAFVDEVVNVLSITDTWRYDDSGTDLGTSWREVGFDDSAWSAGGGLFFDEGEPLPAPKTTPIATGSVTYYFRKHLTVPENLLYAQWELTTVIDDGAIVYVNGAEVLRLGMPTGSVNAETNATRSVDEADFEGPWVIPGDRFTAGDNVIAVELHNSNTNGDAVFGLQLDAITTTEIGQVPDAWGLLDHLRITEILYNSGDNPSLEFIELQNTGPGALNLAGVRLTDAVEFTFGDVELAPGEYAVVVRDVAAFEAEFGTEPNVVGRYTGALSNGGERIQLELPTPFRADILDFEYDDAWHPSTDGGGHSLVIVDAMADVAQWGLASGWHPSFFVLGTPGFADREQIVINEVLANTLAAEGGWIEIKNTTGHDVDVGGWFLSDDPADAAKYRIADGTVIPANGFITLFEQATFGNGSAAVPFGLDVGGGHLLLSGATAEGTITGYLESVDYVVAEVEVPTGRHRTRDGATHFVRLMHPTPLAPNAPPAIAPVVISEVMYLPGNVTGEFVELFNRTGAPIALHDGVAGWQLSGSATYAFAPGEMIPAGGMALLVPGDPATFRADFNVPPDVPIFGPYGGMLGDAGGDVSLVMPDAAGGPQQLMVLADQVRYESQSPWPQNAAGGGSSLIRAEMDEYGNDVANWVAGNIGGTPGVLNLVLDSSPPSSPTGLAAAAGSTARIDLAWTDSVDPESGVVSYRVWRNDQLVGIAQSSSFSDFAALPGVPYEYAVSAVNGDGVEGERGDAVTVTMAGLTSVIASETTRVLATFSEPLDATSATNIGNYTIAGIAVHTVTLLEGGATVALTTDPLTADVEYAFAASQLAVASGNLLPTSLTAAFTLGLPGFTVRDVRAADLNVNDLGDSDLLLGLPLGSPQIGSESTAILSLINLRDPENPSLDGNFGNNLPFPNDSSSDDDDFTIMATGSVFIPAEPAGSWTIGINSDDGSRLRIDGVDVIVDDSGHAPLDRLVTLDLAPGFHDFELVYFENGGVAEVELFAAPGSFTAVTQTDTWRLIGDTAAGGLTVITDPLPPRPVLWDAMVSTASLVMSYEDSAALVEAFVPQRYEAEVLGGQRLSVEVEPLSAQVSVTVQVIGPSGLLVETTSAAGDLLRISDLLVPQDGLYEISVSADQPSEFAFQAVLNATCETEPNHTVEQSQSLASGSWPLTGGGQRLAVTGLAEPATADVFRIPLAGGQTLAADLSSLGAGGLELTLLDENGQLRAVSHSQSAGRRNVIAQFVAPVDGEFYLRIAGGNDTDYLLVATIGAHFDIGGNAELATAIDVTTSGSVLGAVSEGGVTGSGASDGVSINLSTTLIDAEGFLWDIQTDGNINNGTSDAYDGGHRHTGFPGSSDALAEDDGREVVIGPFAVGQVEVTRKIFIPQQQAYARFLEIVTNPTASTIQYTVPIYTNLGSDGTFGELVTTSSGDAVFTVGDDWILTDDTDGSNDPSMIHVIAGPGGMRPSSVDADGTGDVGYNFDLTLAPGETRIVMHFGAQSANRDEALAKAIQLAALNLDALAGMTPGELAQVVNFPVQVDDVDAYRFQVVAGDSINLSTRTPDLGSQTYEQPALAYADTVLQSGPVAYWRLNETAGAVAFDLADGDGAQNGILNGATSETHGVLPGDGAARFDGVDDFIALGDPAALQIIGTISIEAWVQVESTDGLRNIVVKGHTENPDAEVALRIWDGRYQILTWNGPGAQASADVPAEDVGTGKWTHLVGAYDGTRWTLYRDGQPIDTSSETTMGAIAVGEDWAIGARGTGTSRFFHGAIDEVAIFDYALDAQQVAAHFGAGVTRPGSANLLDPRVELYDPNGNLVAANNDGAADLRNAELDYTALLSGAYTVLVRAEDGTGPYELSIDGFTGSLPALEVLGSDPTDGQVVLFGQFPQTVSVQLSEAIDVSSLDAADLTVNGVPATDAALITPSLLQFTIDPAVNTGDGDYVIHVAADSLFSTRGQVNTAHYTASFSTDTAGPRILDVAFNGAPLPGDTILSAQDLTRIEVTFDEALARDPVAWIFESTTGNFISPAVLLYDPQALHLTMEYATLPEGQYQLWVYSGDGWTEDVAGNDLDGDALGSNPGGVPTGDGVPGGHYTASFLVEGVQVDLDGLWRPLTPLGSQVYQNVNSGSIVYDGDVDQYLFDLEAGELLAARVAPLPSAGVTSLRLLDDTESVIGAAHWSIETVGTIGVNFVGAGTSGPGAVVTGTAGVAAQDHWNNMEGKSGSSPGLLDDAGDVTTVGVVWTASNTWIVDDHAPVDGNAELMKGYLDTTDTSSTTVTVSGVPYETYDVILYFDGGNESGNRSGQYAVNDGVRRQTQGPYRDAANWPLITGGDAFALADQPEEAGNYAVFRGFTGGAFTVTATPIEFRAPLNAIQIVGYAPTLVVDSGFEGWVSADEAALEMPVDASGRYTVEIESTLVGAEYDLVLMRNARLESGDTNEFSSQSIDDSRVAFIPERLAVSGRFFAQPQPADVWAVQPASGKILRIDPASGAVLGDFDAPAGLLPQHTRIGLSVAEGGSLLLYVNSEAAPGVLYVIDPATGATLTTLATTAGAVDGLAFVSSASSAPFLFLAAGSQGVVWQDGVSGAQQADWATGTPVGGLAGDDTGRLFGVFDDGAIHELDPYTDTDGYLRTFPAPAADVEGMAYDGQQLYVSTASGRLIAIDPHTGQPTHEVSVAGGGLFGLAAQRIDATDPGEVLEVEPNNSIAGAQPIDGAFSLAENDNIGDSIGNTSTTIPHTTIFGTGDGTFDFYAFTVDQPNSRGIFDIDFGADNNYMDAYLRLYNADGVLLSSNDDTSTSYGAGGSTSGLDSYLELTFDTAGTYVIEVGTCCVSTVDNGADYQLQVSIEGHALAVTVPVSPDPDQYTIDLTGLVDQPIDILLSAVDGGVLEQASLELIAPDGQSVLAVGTADPTGTTATNYQLGILGFSVPADGVYSIRAASSSNAEYVVLVSQSLTFDSEPNSTPTGALRSLDDTGAALGWTALGAGAYDYYQVTLLADEQYVVFTDTPLAASVNALDPQVVILDPSDATVTQFSGGADDGRNVVARFGATEAGVYTIGVVAQSGAGSYRLSVAPAASVQARHLLYNNSSYDGFDAAINANDDLALAHDKSPLLPGQPASFANVSSFVHGINSVAIDVRGLARPADVTLEDFEFRVGNDDDPEGWEAAPLPGDIAVRTLDATAGVDRITVTWPDGAISGQWLQVRLIATAVTGLPLDDVFYFGSAVGETGNSPSNALVTAADVIAVRDHARGPANRAAIADPHDFNRDRVVDALDQLLARNNVTSPFTSLRLIEPPFTGTAIVGRRLFYNGSAFDGGDPAPNSDDDAAIAFDKTALLPGQNASFANYTSYAAGINGIAIDFAGLPNVAAITLNDFEFRAGNDNDPSAWRNVSLSGAALRPGQGVDDSDRVMFTFGDGSIRNEWFQVRIRGNERTGLLQDDVFYFGNAVGETGNRADNALVTAADLVAIRDNPRGAGNRASIDNVHDVNRDRFVDAVDSLLARNAVTGPFDALRLIQP